MNTQSSHIYTAEDIKKYLEGKLTPAQMHAMEKVALDDSFLAEAIEGYQENGATNWETHLQNIKQALAQKQTVAKVVPISTHKKIIWRVAAAVLLISGLGVAYNLINKKTASPSTEIAVNKTTTAPNAFADSNDINTETIVSNTTTSTTPAPSTNTKEEKSTNTLATAEEKQMPKQQANNEDLAKQLNREDKKYVDVAVTPAPAPITNQMDKVAEGAAIKEAAAANEVATVAKNKAANKPASSTNYNFTSQVFASDNTPLPFANITIEKDGFGTYADVKGNFRLNSTDSFVTVLVKSVGYQPRYYTLNSKTALNKITLQEAAMDPKNQVVIASSNKARATSRKATFLKDTIINVEPKDGWANYSTYISNNIDLPDDVGKDFTKGKREMEVSFEVSSTGAITNIKIDDSNCNGCDKEAIKRAIQQGPQWKPKNGKAGSAKIKVQF